MATVFTQLALLLRDGLTASLRLLFLASAVLRRQEEPWRSEYIMRDDDTGCRAERVYALPPQVWDRLSKQPPQ